MMDNLVGFVAANVCVLFFANGLAFFAMGLAIALEARRVSTLVMNNSLYFLAGFGLAACVGNWMQMFYTGLAHGSPVVISPFEQAIKLSGFALASVLLLEFSVRLATARKPAYRWLRTGFWVVLVVYVSAAAVLFAVIRGPNGDPLAAIEMLTRYLLYSPALALACLALYAQSSEFVEMRLLTAGRDAKGAALAFGTKLIVSGLIAVPLLGPAGPVLSGWTLALQVMRTLTTVAVAYFVVRILRIFEIERQQQLDRAIQERFQAQESALAAQKQVCADIEQWSDTIADLVQTVSSAISQPTSLEETMQIVLRETITLAGLQRGFVHLVDEETQTLSQVARHGVPDWFAQALVTVKVGDGLAGWVAEKGEVLIVDDLGHDPRPFVPKTTDVVRFYAGIPLQASGKVLGVMSLLHPQVHRLSDQQVVLLAAVGQQLGIAIENSRLYQRVRYLATAEERSRLARELHDNLAQLLGYLNLRAARAEQLLVEGQVKDAREVLGEVKQIAQGAYSDARETIFSLRATTSGTGFLETLKEWLADYRMYYGLEADLIVDDSSPIHVSADAGIQILSIVQEAVTNVRKHAGASRVQIRCEPRDGQVRIAIQDDGHGFDVEQLERSGGRQFGLAIMRERAESVGGGLEVNSRPGAGTTVVIWMPKSGGK